MLADFSEVPYIDSTGIGFLVGVYTSVTNTLGGRFVITGPNPRVREVLDLMRLSSVIPITADEASGLAFLNARPPAAPISGTKPRFLTVPPAFFGLLYLILSTIKLV